MAVRDDFAAGEVLAAADLNDTFASKLPYSYGTATPSTSDSGFLWYDSNSTPAEVKFWDGAAFQPVAAAGGLVLLGTAALSGSSVSLNNVFTTDYRCYRINIYVEGTSVNSFIGVRMRASGSDETGSVYERQQVSGSGSTASASAFSSSFFATGASGDNTQSTLFGDLVDPAATKRTWLQSLAGDVSTSRAQADYVNNTTAYDGITVFPNSGTMSGGFISVYGYTE